MPSKIKTDPEPAIYFINSADVGLVPGGDSHCQFNPGNLPPASGRVSTMWDLGLGPRTSLFEWRSVAQLPWSSGTIGTTVEQYLACSDDGVLIDGLVPLTDAYLTNSDQRRNLSYLGGVTGDGNTTLVNSGVVQIFSRYVSVVWWNSTPVNLGPSGHMLILTPCPDELQ